MLPQNSTLGRPIEFLFYLTPLKWPISFHKFSKRPRPRVGSRRMREIDNPGNRGWANTCHVQHPAGTPQCRLVDVEVSSPGPGLLRARAHDLSLRSAPRSTMAAEWRTWSKGSQRTAADLDAGHGLPLALVAADSSTATATTDANLAA